MRLICKILVVFASFLMFVNVVAAVSNPYGKYQDLYGVKTVRCTWYAWEQAYNNAGVTLPGWGNAQEWYNSAAMYGYSVGKEASANSIAVWSSSDAYGHVAYVVSVDSDGKYMTVNEGGIPTTENDGIVIGARKSTSAANLIGFIYLNDAPKDASNTMIKEENTNNDKSSNNNLSSLDINVDDFLFDKNTLIYNLNVPYETNIISIVATPEDDAATVTGAGDKALSVGNNTFYITVTALDGSTKEYEININRSEKIQESVNVGVTTIREVGGNNIVFYILGSIVILLVLIMVVIILSLKKKKIKLIAFDLVGVLVTEKDLLLTEEENNIEKLFGANKSDEEYISLAKKYIKNKEELISVTKNLINNLYEVKYPNVFGELKKKNSNIILVIATNHVKKKKEFIKENFSNVDDIIISAEIGFVKPDQKFYRYILDKYNLNASEVLFVDDSQKNIDGAKNIGMQVLKVHNKTNLVKIINKKFRF